MLRVRLDMNGDVFEVLEIANRDDQISSRPKPDEVSDYDYRFGTARGRGGAITFGRWYIVRGHRRADGAWPLVMRTLARRTAGRQEISEYKGH